MTSLSVSAPTFEHHRVPLGIGEQAPRISYRVTAEPGWTQRAYEVEIVTGQTTSTSGPVESDESVLVPWPGSVMASRQRSRVRVRVWGEDDVPSDWSPVATVEAGLLTTADWTAAAIAPAFELADNDTAPSLLRRDFFVAHEVCEARLYITAQGLYEAELNGARVGDDALAPGWTSYPNRLRYYTYDVTDLVHQGRNTIGVWLADGWYRGRLGFHGGESNRYGDQRALLVQLEVRLMDGSTVTIDSDDQWRSSRGPILASSLYDGEDYDARAYPAGWSSPGFDDGSWSEVQRASLDPATLVAPDGPPVRCTQEVAPVARWTTASGGTLLDFGQNLVGRLRISVQGRAGHQVRLRHAEVLEGGELCVRPLRGAAATDSYVLAGDGVETWEPKFTFHGFRYAEITGWEGGSIAGNVVARVYHTDMERTGHFECSDPLVNRLHENVLWSMRGNFVDIPTDCPQRDERLGWTGDIQVFAPTAAFLYNSTGMLRSWLKDLAVEQLPDGNVPWYVPYIPTIPMWTPPEPSAVWGDAAVLTPWDLYTATGDQGLLAQQYDSAKAWVDLVDRLAGADHVWDEGGYQLGDWLDPAAPPDDPAAAMTDPYLVGTAYFAWSARHLAAMASIVGHNHDATHYALLAEQVRAGFCGRYLRDDGLLASDTQTAYALALCFDLLPEEHRGAAGDRLAQLVAKAGNKIATGFAGTPLVTEALTRAGHLDSAYALLLERECPSWLYAVTQGATTIWERWDSLLPDGRINPGNMTSFNHYALGAVANWLHRRVAGIEAAAPGYREILFRPQPGGGLTRASASHETPYGRASIRWELDAAQVMRVEVTVPTGTTATVHLPGSDPVRVGSGFHRFDGAAADEGS